MVELVENKVTIGASVNIKNAFNDATKNFAEYFKTTDQFWKNATQRVKDHDEAAKHMANRVAGKSKDSIAGAFDAAAAGLTGFSIGFIRGAREEVSKDFVEAIEKIVTAYADRETAENYLRASMHLSNEELKALFQRFHELGPTVGKYPEQLALEWDHLATTNKKLIDSFQPLQMFGAAVRADWQSVVALAQQATIAGVKPADMPGFLDKSTQALMRTGQRGVTATTMVSDNFHKAGLQGAELQKQIAVIVSGLTPAFQNNPIAAANAMTEFMDPILEQKGNDSRMDDWIERLTKGKVTLIEFFDEAFRRNDPASQDFYRKLQADPRTKDLIKAWETQREVIHDLWKTEPTPLKDLEIFSESAALELHRLAESLHELAVVVGSMSDAIDVLRAMSKAVDGFKQNLVDLQAEVKSIGEDLTFSKAKDLWLTLFALTPQGALTLKQFETYRWLWDRSKARLRGGGDAPGDPKKFAEGGTVDRNTLAMTGEKGRELIMGSDGAIKRVTDKATISTLNAGDSVVPMVGASTGLPRQQTPGFNPDTARYGPDPGGGYYTKATTYGGHPGDPSRGIPRVTDPGDAFGSNQARVKEEHQGISLPGTPFGGTETSGPELNKLYQVQLPDGSWTLQRVTDTGPGHKGHGGTDISMGAISREYGGDPRKFGGGNIRYKRFEGGQLPSSMRAGRNLITAGGYLDTSSGEGSLPYGSAEYDIPGRYKPPTAEAFKPQPKKLKVSMEVEPPPRRQIERAARYTDQIGSRHAQRQHQAAHAGNIGFA